MRALQVIDDLNPSSSEGRRVMTIARELSISGHQVTVMAGSRSPSEELLIEQDVGSSVEMIWHQPLLSFRQLRFSPNIHTLIHEASPDLVHAHSFRHYGTFASSLYQRLERKPYVVSPYGTLSYESSNNLTAFYILQDLLTLGYPLRRATRILANTLYEKRQIIRYGGDPDKIRVIYREVDTKQFRKRESRVLEPETVSYIGRVTPLKGIELIIEAMGYSKTRFSLALIGPVEDAGYQKKLVQLTERTGVRDRVKFISGVPYEAIPDYFSSSSLVVLPSLYENLGGVLLEAQACECPVIATDVGGVSESILDGRTGFLLKERSPELLAGKIDEVLGDDKLRRRMGLRGRRFVERRFSTAQYMGRIMGAYEEALSAT